MTATLNSVVAEESDVTSDIDNNAVLKSQKQDNEPNAAENTNDSNQYICGVAVSLEIIGGKWKGVI